MDTFLWLLLRILRWTILLGLFFLIGVGVWAIVTVTRMKREQQIALALLNFMAQQAGLKRDIDRLQSGLVEDAKRERSLPETEEPSHARRDSDSQDGTER